MVGSALVAFFPHDSATVNTAEPSIPGNVFYGLVTIAQNGTVVYAGTGNTGILTQNGNHFNLTGVVSGEISIQHNNTILNGLGNQVNTGSQPTLNMLNITNVTHVIVRNISLNSADESGIFIQNATHVLVSNVNISAYKYAAQILNNTEYINVSNSVLSFNAHSSDNISTIVDGAYGSSFGGFIYLYSSLDNSFFNDTIYGSLYGGSPASITSNAEHTAFDDLHFIGPAFYGASLTASNESLSHSTFNGPFVTGVILRSLSMSVGVIESSIVTPHELQNVSIIGNSFNFYRTTNTGVTISGINTYSDANISGNTININNAGASTYSQAIGILAEGTSTIPVFATNGSIVPNQIIEAAPPIFTPSEVGWVSIKDNSISIENSSISTSGIASVSSIVNISNNNLHFSNASAEAINLENSHFSNVSYNTVALVNSNGPNGIFVSQGSNESISHNTFSYTNATVGGMGIFLYHTQNETISNNSISGFLADFGTNWAGNVTFMGNYLENSNTSITLNATHNAEFYHNDFSSYSYAPANITNSTNILLNASSPVGGNYWSGYTGTAAPDGFGSTPYVVSSGYKDYLPLTHRWTRPQALFTETGLPTDTQWSVIFNGQTGISTQDTMSFNILNGTYSAYNYTIDAPAGYYASESNGSYQYAGSSFTTSIVFTHYAYLNGTILPANATVLLNGVLMNGLTSGSFNVSLKAGTYELIVNESGYNTYYLNFTVNPDQTEHVNISLNSTSGSNVQDYYFIGAGAVVVVLAGVGSLFYRRRN